MSVSAMLIVAVILFLACYMLRKVFDHIVLLYYVHKIPGPPTHDLISGNMRPLHDTPAKNFQAARKWAALHYPIYKLWIGPIAFPNMLSPEDIGIVLADMKHNKKSIAYNAFKSWLQRGLLTSDGEKWVQRRKILTPTFHFTILQDFILTFNERTQELVQKLKEDRDKPYTEITEVITTLTLKIITETAMGRKMDFNTKKESEYENSLHELAQIIVYRSFRSYLLYEWLYMFTSNFFKELKLLKILHGFTKEVIAEREQTLSYGNEDFTKKRRLAMLDLLLTVKRESGIIDDSGIREEVDTFMFEGHDTISSGICTGLMLIACHPKIQEEIVQEMREVLGDIKKKPDYNDLQELKYLERCIKEVLRLYPSVPFISRVLGEDIITHSGYKVKKDTIVGIHIFDLHRNPDIYPDPEKFDPDRFLPENCKNRHPYAYIPFSAGPRNCIGQRFAMLEMKAAFCGILGNFVLEAVDTPDSIVPITDVIFRTQNKIKVKFVPRE